MLADVASQFGSDTQNLNVACQINSLKVGARDCQALRHCNPLWPELDLWTLNVVSSVLLLKSWRVLREQVRLLGMMPVRQTLDLWKRNLPLKLSP